jgi:hypothetical protein
MINCLQKNKNIITRKELLKQYIGRLQIYLTEKCFSLLRTPLNQHIMVFILLMILQGYLTSKGLLENNDDAVFSDPKYQAFMQRHINNQHAIIEQYIRNCTSKPELSRIQKVVEHLIEVHNTPGDVVPAEKTYTEIMDKEEPTANWKERLLLFVGLSSLAIIFAYCSKDMFSLIVDIVSSITIHDLQNNILNQVNVLMQLDPDKISEIYDILHFPEEN